TTAAGIDFEVAEDELRLESMADLTWGDFHVNLLETGGLTMARMWIALDASYISIMVTQLGTDPGIEVVWSGAGSTLVNEIGFDGVTGSLGDVTIDGNLGHLGGASNLNGGQITSVGTLTVSESILGTVSVTGRLDALDVAGDVNRIVAGSAGELVIGGNLTGGLTVGGSLLSLDVGGNVTGGTVQIGSATSVTVGGDLAAPMTVSGRLYELHAGSLSSGSVKAGSMHELDVEGSLSGRVMTAPGGAIDDLRVGGTLSGSVQAGGDAWSSRGAIGRIQVGGISGYVMGKFDDSGVLTVNGQRWVMGSGMPFRYDGRLWPEWLPYETISGRTVAGFGGSDALAGAFGAGGAGLAGGDLAEALSGAFGRHTSAPSRAWSFDAVGFDPVRLYNPEYRGTHSLDDGDSGRDPPASDPASDDAEETDPAADELVQRLVDLSADPAGAASGTLLRRFWSRLRQAVSQNDHDLAEALDEAVTETASRLGGDPVTEAVLRMADDTGPGAAGDVPSEDAAPAEGDAPSPQEEAPAAEPAEEAPARL
ncbi:MAG TPA: hypothetical protein PLP01_13690, partial [Phycisphaerae bacterium]|nr:hypothetical protein [Phycisphaerae bacterium]